MKKVIYPSMIAAIILAGACLGSCSDVLLDEMNSRTASNYTPVPTLADRSLISRHETLSFVFAESMKDSIITLSGSIAANPGLGLQWSATNKEKDTLTLNPSGSVLWNEGSSQTLIIQLEAEGEEVSYTFSYSVVKALFVANPGDTPSGTENGSITRPFKTIQAAIDAAKTLYIDAGKGQVDVLVGAGEYKESCNANGVYVVNMEEGVSIYGSYAPGFGTHDTETQVSRIIDLDEAGSSTFMTHPVHAGEGVTNDTVLDGFEIHLAGKKDKHAGIYCDGGSPTLSNLVIKGPSNSSLAGNKYYAISLLNSSAIVESCDIDPGYVNIDFGESYGINISGDSPAQVRNSTISGGRGNVCYGIHVNKPESAPAEEHAIISGNTIDGGYWGSGEFSTGTAIWLTDRANPEITGNHFVCIIGGAEDMWGIYESSDYSDPIAVRNNFFGFNCHYFEPNPDNPQTFGYWYWEKDKTPISQNNYDDNTITTEEGENLLLCPEWGNTGTFD